MLSFPQPERIESRIAHDQIWPEAQPWHYSRRERRGSQEHKSRAARDTKEKRTATKEQINGTLLLAALEGDKNLLQKALASGAELEARSSDTAATPLMLASAAGWVDTVETLLDLQADVMAKDSVGATALVLASFQGRNKVIDKMYQHGQAQGFWADLLSQATRRGETALMAASKAGHAATVRRLLEYGSDVNSTSISGNTALHLACAKGLPEVAEVLIDRGADVSMAAADGCTPFLRAAATASTSTVKLLLTRLNQSDIHERDKEGFSALHLSAKAGKVGALTALLDHGMDVGMRRTGASNADGSETPLISAVRAGQTDAVALLLGYKADVEQRAGGRTPLGWAASEGKMRVARLLVDIGGADLLAIDKRTGRVPRQLAEACGHIQTSQMLSKMARGEWLQLRPEDQCLQPSHEMALAHVPPAPHILRDRGNKEAW